MKNLLLMLIIILASCSTNENSEEKDHFENLVIDTVVLDKQEPRGEEDKEIGEKINFDVLKYKQGVDSLLIEVIGKESQTELLVDTLTAGNLVFVELKRTPLANITGEAIRSIKYSFQLAKKNSGLRHHLIVLTFETSVKADSVFAIFKNVALDKSGVPGLTYSSDYVVQAEKVIYWLNSNCAYSYASHGKFVAILKEMTDLAEDDAIYCECGKVLCTTPMKR